MSEILILQLDLVCWLKQMCNWWHMTCCARVTGWEGDQWSRGCPCCWVPIMISTGILTIRTRLHHHRRRLSGWIAWLGHARMFVSVCVTVSTHVELRLPRGGWKNEREIVARNKNMLRTKHQSWQNKHWALLVIFMLVAWKCDVFRLHKTKR